eukprot:TRINITY_DN7710_c0_g1_i2.p1 TRINITY_DN7710_c0_g1~~TRINITY_DN7710_c0_g1_i2.p1  ORF type:complete len:695 (+),score=117.59 TRINITY_DN7710_c0_g1_i2:61-2145(+)
MPLPGGMRTAVALAVFVCLGVTSAQEYSLKGAAASRRLDRGPGQVSGADETVGADQGKQRPENSELERGEQNEGAKEGEEEGGDEILEEGEQEEHFTRSDIAEAKLLLGSVFVMMVLFYVVNYPDDDIRRYAWDIISSTISIFVAVLMFNGIAEAINVTLERYSISSRADASFKVLVSYIVFIIWFILLQVVIAVCSGAYCEAEERKPDWHKKIWVIQDAYMGTEHFDEIADKDLRGYTEDSCDSYDRIGEGSKGIAWLPKYGDVFVVKRPEQRIQRQHQVKAWSTLWAHMVGFAAIRAGGELQHFGLFAASPRGSILCVIVTEVLILILFRVTLNLRRCTAANLDDTKDERDSLFLEAVRDSENDIASLSTSFLMVQALRFWIAGSLPSVEGEGTGHKHTYGQIGMIFGAALVFAVGLVLLVGLLARLHTSEHESHPRQAKAEDHMKDHDAQPRLIRYTFLSQNICSMAFAWCILWGLDWLVCDIDWFRLHKETPEFMEGKILLALICSSFALGVIFVLDKVQDNVARLTGNAISYKDVQHFIQEIVDAIGMVVGFAWEHSFNASVAALASETTNPVTMKLIFTCAVAVAIVPAWRRYILAKTLFHEDAKEIKESMKHAGEVSPHSYRQLELISSETPRSVLAKPPQAERDEAPASPTRSSTSHLCRTEANPVVIRKACGPGAGSKASAPGKA